MGKKLLKGLALGILFFFSSLIILLMILMFLGGCGRQESESELSLIRGRPAAANEFPEVVRIFTPGSSCTATIVGPRVILTAAHCTANNQVARFRIGRQIFSTRMQVNNNLDLALGVSSTDFPTRPASVDLNTVRVGSQVTLAGFGCTQVGGGGGNDGVLRVGNARVTQVAGVFIRSTNGAALCFGDSGGPAFSIGTKNVVGVNSRGDIRVTNFNSRLDLQASRDFMQNFVSRTNTRICGLNQSC